VRDNRSPTKRIAVWQAIGISAHPVAGRRIVAATVIRIGSFPFSLSPCPSSLALSSSHQDSSGHEAAGASKREAGLFALAWRSINFSGKACGLEGHWHRLFSALL